MAIILAGFLWLFQFSSAVVAVFLLGFIIVLSSRAAFLSVIASALFIIYPYRNRVGKGLSLHKSFAFLLLCTLLLASVIKQNSTAGRLFIWQRSFELWKQNWLTGVGFGKFNTEYNHMQAKYFSTHSITSKNAMLANDGYFAFNEWLHITIEFGIIGFIISLLITWFVAKGCYRNVATKKSWAAAMLIPIFVGSLFSYPLHNVYILAASIFLSLFITLGTYRFPTLYDKWIKGFAVVVLISIVAFYSYRNFKAQQLFGTIKELAREGYRNDAVALCRNASKALQKDYSFQLFYLNLLYQTNRLDEAEKLFDTFHSYHCNQKAHAIMAKCYEEMGDSTKAEEHYLTSLYIVPQLLQSRIELMGFYDRSNNITKAKFWAQQTINCPIKVTNSLAFYLKKQASDYLIKDQ